MVLALSLARCERASWSRPIQRGSAARSYCPAASAAVAVLAGLGVELRLAGREEVVHLVRLAHEEEVVLARRMRRRLDRRQPRVRDRRRRQPRELARVVRVVALELRLP